jgi:hypothetical protein
VLLLFCINLRTSKVKKREFFAGSWESEHMAKRSERKDDMRAIRGNTELLITYFTQFPCSASLYKTKQLRSIQYTNIIQHSTVERDI